MTEFARVRMRRCGIAFALAAATLTGCTTELDVALVSLEKAEPRPGWIYNLPYARFDITITRRLEACSPRNLLLAVDITATPVFEADPTQSYVIDHRSLSSLFKTSNLTIERHDNGMIKTIGVAAEDVTGKVIVNTVTGAINLAKAAQVAMAPTGFVMTAVPPPATVCSQQALADAVDYERKRGVLSRVTGFLEQETKRLKALLDSSAALGRRVDPSIQNQITAAARAVAAQQIAVHTATNDLLEIGKKVVLVDRLRWPADGKTFDAVLRFSPERLSAWLAQPPSSQSAPNLRSDMRVFLRSATRLGLPTAGDPPKPVPPDGASAKGVRYREPVAGSLLVEFCSVAYPVDVAYDPEKPGAIAKECEEESVLEDAALRLQRQPVNVFTKKVTFERDVAASSSLPQLGRLYFLPFDNGPFENNELKAVFRSDGSLLSATYGEKSAPAEVASAAFAQTAAVLAQGAKDLRSQALTLKTEELNAKTAELKARAEYDKAVAALQPSSSKELDEDRAIIEADTALKKARLANIEANRALEKAREPTP